MKQKAAHLVSWCLKNAFFDAHAVLRVLMRKPKAACASPDLLYRQYRDERHHVFFGYYDVSPFHSDMQTILAQQIDRRVMHPQPDSQCTIGYYDFQDTKSSFVPVGKTTTWCWQQGCRLQWYPKSDSHWIAYNCLIGNRHGCVVQDVETKETVRELSRPLYAIDGTGRWGLSLNFARLHRLRPGYGYLNMDDEYAGDNAPANDGLWRIDLKSGEKTLLLSLAEIADYEPLETMNGAEHYLNHLSFNPSSSRILFFHLWAKDKQRWMRMITCDLEGGNRYIVTNEGHVSHFDWKNDREILAYSTHVDSGRRFHLYEDQSDSRTVIGEGILIEDSHPTFSRDGHYLLMDSYPDGYRDQHLFLFDLVENRKVELASFYQPVRYDETQVRCDLHPRWSPCGHYVCNDTVYEGKRSMVVLNVTSMMAS